MNRKQFDELEYIDQVAYVNSELLKGETLRNISESLSMSKTTIRDRFKKIDYRYNKDSRQYVKSNTLVEQPYKSITKVLPKDKSIDKEPLKEGVTKEVQKYEDDILELVKYKRDILEMLKNYKGNTLEIPQINVNDLPGELKDTITNKSFKMYEGIYQLFNEVCSQYQGIKKQDLISLAILEFCNKYNKGFKVCNITKTYK
ncbi:DNA-binding protein [Clostridium sp. DL1XJH146]